MIMLKPISCNYSTSNRGNTSRYIEKQKQNGVIGIFLFEIIKMSFEVLKKKYEALKKNWNAGRLDEVGNHLDSLKLALTEIAFLPTDECEKTDAKVSLILQVTHILVKKLF